MQTVSKEVRARAIAAARGKAPFDILLAGGTVVDVGCGVLREADVGIVGPIIASVHPRAERSDAARTVDATGRFIAPGFMDLHVHFESSMLTPRGYAEAVLPHGTTTVFADPHELGNVAGIKGVRYALDASRGLPLRFIIQAPSCVPPVVGLERSGADFDGTHVAEILAWDGVGGVAEVMDMIGVLERDARMVDVVEAGLVSGKLVSGHAWGLSGGDLQAYLCAGITSDHECISAEDVERRLQAGMTVELRGGFEHMMPGVVQWLLAQPQMPTHLVTCTDDIFADILVRDGGIDHLLRTLVGLGLPAVSAIQLATINGAYRLRRTDLGFVGAGRRADLVILDDLDGIAVNEVFADGVLVAAGGAMCVELAEPPASVPVKTMYVESMPPERFVMRLNDVKDGQVTLRTIDNPLFTQWGETKVTVRDHVVDIPDGYVIQAAVHRHGRFPAVTELALLGGWGKWSGAIATTVAHDTHNLVVFGTSPTAMSAAANAVIAADGGLAVADAKGEVLNCLPLPIAGLLSPDPVSDVAARQRALEAAARKVGEFTPFLKNPLLQCMASSLACLPGPHLTDVGLVDGSTGKRVLTALVAE